MGGFKACPSRMIQSFCFCWLRAASLAQPKTICSLETLFVQHKHARTSTTSSHAATGTRLSVLALDPLQRVLQATLSTHGTKCYILRSGQTSWSDASALCRSNGDDRLAVITSANQNTAVQGLIGSTNAYIGLSDTATEGTFLWTDGSTASSYSNWISGQPATQDNQDS